MNENTNATFQQSEAERENPPTETAAATDAETLAATTSWACITGEVGYGDYDSEESLDDKLSEIDTALVGKASTVHTHSVNDVNGLAPVATSGSYTDLSGKPTLATVATSGDYDDLTNKPTAYTHPTSHPATMITGLAEVATTGSYNDLADKPTIPTIPTSLPANGGNSDTVDGMHASEFAVANHTHGQYASVTHGHAVSDVTGLAGELDGKADASHTHDYAASTHAHTLADVSETSEKKVMTAAERTKLEGVEANANNYIHPANHAASMITGLATVATSGKYTDLSDKPTTMTPSAHTHAQSDVTGLTTALAGKADTEHSHNQADVSGLSDALAGKANATHTHSDYAASSHTHTQGEITGLTAALSGKSDTNHTHTQSGVEGLTEALATKANASHTHTAASIGAAASDHDHDEEYILKALQFTADNGNIKHSYEATDDVLAKMADLDCGVHTCYCPVASVNAPKQTEAWRFLVHKTGTSKNYGWCMAFGSRGSVYSNYIDQGNWRGWKTIHDIEPEPLWTGAMYMTSGHTVTPTKTLSQCRNGWMLLWSDYDAGDSENNYDFSVTMIPKRAYTGQVWGGGQFLCMVPSHYAVDSNNYMMKCLHIHDTKIVGHEYNTAVERNDVVLRAVYEF